ncbi:hypothetical protein [Flavihumibacter fluvii]|uniref:hypothetical protein n=1 Tax=Flavihumibacter fluvii TaxID=2838157 RepID=UPI001BDE456D|nr:hypothetical protein [Flavihumibacter fluvii]ULQ54243.1 hypothetical protein KJS93_07920 [Flavihumibacter fluvii]
MKYQLAAAFLSLVILSACKKDTPVSIPNPSPGKLVTVILNPEYLPLAKIDSAYITWPRGETTDSVKLHASGNDLSVSFDQLPSTEKTFRLHLFTNQNLASNKLLWQKEFTVALSQRNALNVVAPLSIDDVNWVPRIMLQDQSGLQAFSGIRPNDAYFRFHKIEQSWKEIAMDRSYWNVTGPDTKIAGAEWRGTNVLDATGSYENHDFYNFLPVQIGSREWNHIEIVMLFTNATNTQTRVLVFNHSFD